MGSSSSFEEMVGAFSTQVGELREATLLRVDDTTRGLCAADLASLEAALRAVEAKFRDVRAFARREAAAVPAVAALAAAAAAQRAHLEHIAARLPAHLPSLPSPEKAPLRERAPNTAAAAEPAATAAAAAAAKPAPRRPAPAPRRFVSAAELAAAPAYMRGRLTQERVNAALAELAALAEANAAAAAAARRGRPPPPGASAARAAFLGHVVARAPALAGRPHWVLEADLRSSTAAPAVRLDNTGRALMTLLRHLGRVAEARVAGDDGATHLVYVLTAA